MTTGLESGFTLGPWDVRPQLGTLSGPDGEVHVEPKVMGVLVCVAEPARSSLGLDRYWDQYGWKRLSAGITDPD